MALVNYPDVDKIAQHQPLKLALALSSDMLAACYAVSIGDLGLSVRPSNCLAKRSIATLDQLLSLTITELFEIPAMGRASVEEIVRRLSRHLRKAKDVTPPAVAGIKNRGSDSRCSTNLELDPHTLQDEWTFFSCGAKADMPLSALALSSDLASKMPTKWNEELSSILAWTWDQARQILSDDHAEELLDALVMLAQDYRNTTSECPSKLKVDSTALRRLLEARWADCTMAQCGLRRRSRLTLQKAGILNLRQLINALDPLLPALCLDVKAFVEIWNRLILLGLREGDAYDQWIRLATQEEWPVSLDDVASEMQLACDERHWTVLSLRYGLYPDRSQSDDDERVRYTLEEVAQRLDITRERVRQIERRAIEKLQQYNVAPWQSLIATLHYFVEADGGLMSVRDAAETLTAYFPALSLNAEAFCHMLFELSEEFASVQRGLVYSTESVPAICYPLIVERAVKLVKTNLVALSLEELRQQVQESLENEGHDISPPIINACLRADGRFSSDYKRRDLNFHLLETLRRIGRPAHFTEIASVLNASGWRRNPIAEKSVGNRLNGERDLFVYVGVGTYGLVEWGSADKRAFDRYKNGYIQDIIEEFLAERDEPAETSEIIAFVLSRKRCQEFSILQRLSRDDRFHAFARGTYGLKKWVM